jgi:2-iminobutanoate/2-iminopropanoate deaminase
LKRFLIVALLLLMALFLNACSNPNAKRVVNSDQAPAAIGSYSQAIQAGDMIYTSGQIALDPATGEMVSSDIKAQTEQAMENLKKVIEAGGSDLSQVVKVTLYIKDMDDFSAINEIYGSYFTDNYPARSCVEVSELPKGALIEIEAIAAVSK